jgi:hypothetical protein
METNPLVSCLHCIRACILTGFVDLPFLPIRDVQPFLTLEVAAVQTRGNPLFT